MDLVIRGRRSSSGSSGGELAKVTGGLMIFESEPLRGDSGFYDRSALTNVY